MRLPVALALVLAAAPGAALPPVELGARAGFATALGDAARDVGMNELTVTSQLPLQLDGWARVWREVAAGAYLSYGLGRAGGAAIFGACGVPGVSCSGRAIRAGVQGRWSLAQASPVPWAGLGLGWEWARVEGKDATGTSRVDVSGPELTLQAGADWRVTPRLAVGPHVQLGIGRYRSAEVAVGGATVRSGAIAHQAFHGWLGLGAGGRFDL